VRSLTTCDTSCAASRPWVNLQVLLANHPSNPQGHMLYWPRGHNRQRTTAAMTSAGPAAASCRPVANSAITQPDRGRSLPMDGPASMNLANPGTIGGDANEFLQGNWPVRIGDNQGPDAHAFNTANRRVRPVCTPYAPW
jgi:hypothetical protein